MVIMLSTFIHHHRSFHMMIHEPKCIQWKRQGAERVTILTANMSHEQEFEFWQKKTEQLKLHIQAKVKIAQQVAEPDAR